MSSFEDRSVLVIPSPNGVEVLRLVMIDVQNEPAAESHVDELEPAADAQHRDVPAEGGVDRTELKVVPLQIRLLRQARRIGFPVSRR